MTLEELKQKYPGWTFEGYPKGWLVRPSFGAAIHVSAMGHGLFRIASPRGELKFVMEDRLWAAVDEVMW